MNHLFQPEELPMRYAILSVCFVLAVAVVGCGGAADSSTSKDKKDEKRAEESLKLTDAQIQEVVNFKQKQDTDAKLKLIAEQRAEEDREIMRHRSALKLAEQEIEIRVKHEAKAELERLIKQDDVISKLKAKLEKQESELKVREEAFEKRKRAQEEELKNELLIAAKSRELIIFKVSPPLPPRNPFPSLAERKEFVEKFKDFEDKLIKMEEGIKKLILSPPK